MARLIYRRAGYLACSCRGIGACYDGEMWQPQRWEFNAQSSHLEPQAHRRESTLEMTRFFHLWKPACRDTSSNKVIPPRPLKQYQQLENKCSNPFIMEHTSPFKLHSIWVSVGIFFLILYKITHTATEMRQMRSLFLTGLWKLLKIPTFSFYNFWLLIF